VYLPNVKPDHFIVQASGDSMEPTIRDGDYALVHPQPSADHMDVVVAKDPFGAVTIKRLKKIAPEKFVLTYDNSRYQGMVLDINGEWVVIGKVVKVISVRSV